MRCTDVKSTVFLIVFLDFKKVEILKLRLLRHIKCASIHSMKTILLFNIMNYLKNSIYNKITRSQLACQTQHNAIYYNKKKPSVVANNRRLAPDCLKIEFQNVIQLDNLRPSRSNYASPLHIITKKGTLEWRLVDDYFP